MNRTPLNILVVFDRKRIQGPVSRALKEEGYSVDVRSVSAAERRLGTLSYDLVVVDWNALSLCRTIRQSGLCTPVLILTAHDGIESKLQAFESGVDDYLTIPFHFAELVARVRALLRRYDIIWSGKLMLNLRDRAATWAGRRLNLTGREFTLLTLLARNAGRVLTREQMFEKICGSKQVPSSNLIDVHIRNLRLKLGPAAAHLKSVTGRGYVFLLDPERAASLDDPASDHSEPGSASVSGGTEPRPRRLARGNPPRSAVAAATKLAAQGS